MDSPIRLSILLPSRGRPENLRRALCSMLANDAMPDGTELIVGADSDDPTADWLVPTVNGSARWMIGDSFPTLAQKVNSLAAHARGDAMMVFPNDMVVTDPTWHERVKSVIENLREDSLIYAFVGAASEYASLPILRRSQVADLGWYAPPWFPFWFTDSWFTEIVRMSGRGYAVDLGIRHQADVSGTQGLRDLAFWHGFFEQTRPERVVYAAKLRGEPVPAELIETCRRISMENPHPSTYEHYERNAEAIPTPRYAEAKAAAEAHLWKMRRG